MAPEIPPEAKQNLLELFAAFDRNKDGALDFREVAHMLKRFDPGHSLESARNAALEALLISDADSDRRLTQEDFELLITRLLDIGGVDPIEGTQKLLDVSKVSLNSGSFTGTDKQVDQELKESLVADIPLEHLGNRKLHALFDLWDSDGNGAICFEELCQGLTRFKPIQRKQDLTATLSEAARVLKVHDQDGNWQLDRADFADYITSFVHQAGYDLDQVIDYLITLTQQKGDDQRLKKVLEKSHDQIGRMLSHS